MTAKKHIGPHGEAYTDPKECNEAWFSYGMTKYFLPSVERLLGVAIAKDKAVAIGDLSKDD
jgi:hypothetical protein